MVNTCMYMILILILGSLKDSMKKGF